VLPYLRGVRSAQGPHLAIVLRNSWWDHDLLKEVCVWRLEVESGVVSKDQDPKVELQTAAAKAAGGCVEFFVLSLESRGIPPKVVASLPSARNTMHGNDDGCNLETLTPTPDAWSFQTKGRQSSTSKMRQRTTTGFRLGSSPNRPLIGMGWSVGATGLQGQGPSAVCWFHPISPDRLSTSRAQRSHSQNCRWEAIRM